MTARINTLAAALASVVLLVVALPVYTASANDAKQLACNTAYCGG